MAKRSRIVRHKGHAYYGLAKEPMRQLLDCPLKHFLLRWFGDEIPRNIYLALGTIMHRMIEEFWAHEWKSKKSFINTCIRRWVILFKEEARDEQGDITYRKPGKPKMVFRKTIEQDGRALIFKNLEEDYKWGFLKIRRCAKAFVERYWGEPRPLQERQFRFFVDDLALVTRFDLMHPRHVNGRWYTEEEKTGREPLQTHWEATIQIMAWGFAIQDPDVAAALGVTPEIVEEVRKDPLAAFKYSGVIYRLLDREDPALRETFHHRTPAQWLEFARTAKYVQAVAFRAEATGEIPVNREHCPRCEARAVCDRYLAEKHSLATKPIVLFDPDLVVQSVERREPAGDVYLLNFDPRSKTGVRKSTRRRDRRGK